MDNSPVVLVLLPCGTDEGTERLGNLPQVTQLVSDGATSPSSHTLNDDASLADLGLIHAVPA